MVQNNKFSTVFVGQPLIILQSVDSTNTFLKIAVSNSKPYPNGTVIMAVEQYAGRGQQNNIWHAKAGENLTFSLLFKPENMALSVQFDLNKAVSIAVAQTLQAFLPHEKVEIKWPNDILINHKKVAGILIENMTQGEKIKNSIIGVGININQTDFHPEIAPKVSSLKKLTDQEFSLTNVLEQLCIRLERLFLDLENETKNNLHSEYLRILYLYNVESGYKHNGKFFVATITDVDKDGKLVVQTAGSEERFGIKEIEFII